MRTTTSRARISWCLTQPKRCQPSATVEGPFIYVPGEQGLSGYVRLNGELWKAHLHDGVDIPPVGRSVTVEAINGLVVTVRA